MATEVFNDFAASFKEGLTVLLVSLSFLVGGLWSFLRFGGFGGFGFRGLGSGGFGDGSRVDEDHLTKNAEAGVSAALFGEVLDLELKVFYGLLWKV